MKSGVDCSSLYLGHPCDRPLIVCLSFCLRFLSFVGLLACILFSFNISISIIIKFKKIGIFVLHHLLCLADLFGLDFFFSSFGKFSMILLVLLQISAALMFDAGIMACLEFLEAVPWSEDEEEKVIAVLGQLELYDTSADVLQRVSVEPSISSRADGIFLQLLMGVLQAKDEKARRDMKTLISGLLKEDLTYAGNNNRLDVSRDTLYHICHKCLSSLLLCLCEAVSVDESRCDRGVLMGQIAREADNMHWVVDILIEKKMGDDFVTLWADQTELASLHSKLPSMYRYEISRITAQLCIAVGRGQILVPKDARFSLLRTWLEPLYEDFGWMRRACKSIDKKLVEDGLTQTILTLPLAQQQAILLNWFDRFLNKGDDCPNIQRAFEVWWRRAFVRQYAADQDSSHLQITVCDYPA